MRFEFTEDQKLFQASLREVLAKDCSPDVVRAAWNGTRPLALWKKLAELGVIGITVPEAHGGLGLDELSWVLLLEECGRAAVPLPILETVAVGAPLLCDAASEQAKAKWLPRIASGDAVLSAVLHDAAAAVHADIADLVLNAGHDVIIATPREVAVLEEQTSVDGSRRLFYVEGKGTDIADGSATQRAIEDAFDRGALAASAELVGLSQRMIDMTVEYVKVRTQFGVPVGSFQAVKHHLANAAVKLEMARPVVYRAAYSIATNDAAKSMHASMAKACASDAATFVAKTALQCHGAIGYSFEHDLHMWMKRAWALAASWGDAAFHRARVAETLFAHRAPAAK